MSDERVEAIRVRQKIARRYFGESWRQEIATLAFDDMDAVLDRLEAAERERDALDAQLFAESETWAAQLHAAEAKLERATEVIRRYAESDTLSDNEKRIARAFLSEGDSE